MNGSSDILEPEDGLRVLCFDGGGVRGKASLILLKELMDRVGQGAKPCEFFDLIAGTSTGGLISLMLARLQYSVADAIKKYDEIGPRIFHNVAPEGEWVKEGTPLVEEGPAERAFREIGRQGNADGYVANGQYGGCKCLVTTVSQDRPKVLIPIRSYPCDDRADPITSAGGKWKIWEAARAATAAPVYFRPLEKSGRKFIDAGAGYNNPSVEVFHEIKTNIPEFEGRPIACFVSIGTGVSPHRPAPGRAERKSSWGILGNLQDIKGRATDLVQYLAAIASNTAAAHKEMRRAYMPKGPYFRFDPGAAVGAINLADATCLPGMEDLVWEHMQNDETIDEKLQDCARRLQAASSRALQDLFRPNPIEPIPPTPSIQGDWIYLPELLEIVLQNSAPPAFLMIFSFSTNLDLVMELLEARYHNGETSDTTQGCILFLVNMLVRDLWLTKKQISKLDESFIQHSNELIHAPWLAFPRMALNDDLRKTKEEAAAIDHHSLASLIHHIKVKGLAEEIAEALATLEDNLRRTDPVGECVRWMAKSYDQDMLSFPERVKHWVLQSILHAEPADMLECYQLFYKVAKRSRDIYNFSAVRAIMSALRMLERLRVMIKFKPLELREMMSLDFMWLTREAKRKNEPYLPSLQDVLVDHPRLEVAKLADGRQQICWELCEELFADLERFTSQPKARLTSSQKYLFSRDRVMAFVKWSLVEVEAADQVKHKVNDSIRRYDTAHRRPRPRLWRSDSSNVMQKNVDHKQQFAPDPDPSISFNNPTSVIDTPFGQTPLQGLICRTQQHVITAQLALDHAVAQELNISRAFAACGIQGGSYFIQVGFNTDMILLGMGALQEIYIHVDFEIPDDGSIIDQLGKTLSPFPSMLVTPMMLHPIPVLLQDGTEFWALVKDRKILRRSFSICDEPLLPVEAQRRKVGEVGGRIYQDVGVYENERDELQRVQFCSDNLEGGNDTDRGSGSSKCAGFGISGDESQTTSSFNRGSGSPSGGGSGRDDLGSNSGQRTRGPVMERLEIPLSAIVDVEWDQNHRISQHFSVNAMIVITICEGGDSSHASPSFEVDISRLTVQTKPESETRYYLHFARVQIIASGYPTSVLDSSPDTTQDAGSIFEDKGERDATRSTVAEIDRSLNVNFVTSKGQHSGTGEIKNKSGVAVYLNSQGASGDRVMHWNYTIDDKQFGCTFKHPSAPRVKLGFLPPNIPHLEIELLTYWSMFADKVMHRPSFPPLSPLKGQKRACSPAFVNLLQQASISIALENLRGARWFAGPAAETNMTQPLLGEGLQYKMSDEKLVWSNGELVDLNVEFGCGLHGHVNGRTSVTDARLLQPLLTSPSMNHYTTEPSAPPINQSASPVGVSEGIRQQDGSKNSPMTVTRLLDAERAYNDNSDAPSYTNRLENDRVGAVEMRTAVTRHTYCGLALKTQDSQTCSKPTVE